jgi:2-polyprenyl-6-methoxyphenol hydroxylase-like FAD-dependent oxidoreductase
VAGLATALAASRGGHQVVLAERDTETRQLLACGTLRAPHR